MYLILLLTIGGVIALLSAHAGIQLQRLLPTTRRVAVSVGAIVAFMLLFFGISSVRTDTTFIWVLLSVAAGTGFVTGLNHQVRQA